jgi:hypothetical protein
VGAVNWRILAATGVLLERRLFDNLFSATKGGSGSEVPVRAIRKLTLTGDPREAASATDTNADEWRVPK